MRSRRRSGGMRSRRRSRGMRSRRRSRGSGNRSPSVILENMDARERVIYDKLSNCYEDQDIRNAVLIEIGREQAIKNQRRNSSTLQEEDQDIIDARMERRLTRAIQRIISDKYRSRQTRIRPLKTCLKLIGPILAIASAAINVNEHYGLVSPYNAPVPYYPIDEIPDKFKDVANDFSVNRAYEPSTPYECISRPYEYISEGVHGQVYSACRTPYNCEFVVKKSRLGPEFENEVEKLASLNDSGITPKIYAAWTDPKYGYIVTDKLEKCRPRREEYLDVLDKLNKRGYIHRDPHYNNFMCDRSSNLHAIDLSRSINIDSVLPGTARDMIEKDRRVVKRENN